jgi:hypothetical protein
MMFLSCYATVLHLYEILKHRSSWGEGVARLSLMLKDEQIFFVENLLLCSLPAGVDYTDSFINKCHAVR